MSGINKTGFTLIELLLVVAIIAILAAVAIPNFLAAQIRAKVARTKAEMQTIATALESYYNDNNAYPRWAELTLVPPPPGYSSPPVSWRLRPLTTPIAYISSIPGPDPFQPQKDVDIIHDARVYDTYDYLDAESSAEVKGETKNDIGQALYGRMWRLAGCGPDRTQSYGRSDYTGSPPNITWTSYGFYDPTNGLVSNGDIVRLGPPGPYYTAFQLGFDPP